jgi:hypothetical protein
MLARTGLTVAEHQARTVGNYLELRALAPELPFIPVLQGWTISQYLDCVDRYTNAGIDLTALPLVGLGSVCRRQHTPAIAAIVQALASGGLRLHGFGISTRTPTRWKAPTRWPGAPPRAAARSACPAASMRPAPTVPAMRWPGSSA